MNNRLLKFAEILSIIEDKNEIDDTDLQVEDLTNRLEEAVSAITDCIEILKELGMDEDIAAEKIISLLEKEIKD
jgi:hypothetical protein